MDRTILVGSSLGTSRSLDGGATWQTVLPGVGLGALRFSPDFAHDRAAFGGGAGLYRSTDGGATWSVAGLAGETVVSVAVSPAYAADQTLFAGTQSGKVYRSTDGGQNWTSIGPTPGNYQAGCLAISPDFANDHTIFAGYAMSWQWYSGGVYRSTDGGDTWTPVDNGMTYQEIHALAISPNYRLDHTLFATSWFGGVYRSTDGADSWQQENYGLPNLRAAGVVISPNYAADRTLLYGTWGDDATTAGAYISTDGAESWNYYNDGLTNGYMIAMAFVPTYGQDSYILAGDFTGLYAHGPDGYTISGTVAGVDGSGIAGVQVSDGAGHTAVTGASGGYFIANLPAGGYSLTPSKPGYTFIPGSRPVTVVAADVPGQDFTGTTCAAGAWTGQYYANTALTGAPAAVRDGAVDFYWGTGTPLGQIDAAPYSIRWTRRLDLAQPACTRFRTFGSGRLGLWVDGSLQIAGDTDREPFAEQATVACLPAGSHAVQVQYVSPPSGDAMAHLTWYACTDGFGDCSGDTSRRSTRRSTMTDAGGVQHADDRGRRLPHHVVRHGPAAGGRQHDPARAERLSFAEWPAGLHGAAGGGPGWLLGPAKGPIHPQQVRCTEDERYENAPLELRARPAGGPLRRARRGDAGTRALFALIREA